MGAKKADFFDSRDKYLSFVNSTNEKSKIAFELAKYIKKSKITKDAFRIFDAGTGDGSVISTLLSAAHEKFPEDPIIVVGKEISIENLNYWNVELQEPYFSYKEAFQKREKISKKQ